jgi:lysophospholipase L1-like esterase
MTDLANHEPTKRARFRDAVKTAGLALAMTLLTLIALEGILRIADFRMLREGATERSLSYRYDAELGWAPVANSRSVVTTARTIHAAHNSLGLRDIELVFDGRPGILFLGDSFVWGLDVEADERFTELLRPRIPDYTIVNAGVSGYGTDQEYLFLQRLWSTVQPRVVVLVFCTTNDRQDNSTNIRYEGYIKPYFVTGPDGALMLQGQPVPKSRLQYIKENWLVRHLWLARLVTSAYAGIRTPLRFVPDPSERLVDSIRDYVESHGARFLVGLQTSDPALMRHLQDHHIPFVTFDGADTYPDWSGLHWTPEGQKLVADRLFGLLSENKVVPSKVPAPE